MPNLNTKRNNLKVNKKYKEILKSVLISSYEAKACHLGGALSCLRILIDLFYGILKPEDVFVFSKASGVSALYAILADKGYLPKEQLSEYLKQYPLPSREVPGVIWSGGSLGQGLPIAVGLALADRSRDVYVLISDGEVNEGTTWESALFINQHNLTNLWVFCDNNGYQAMGKTDDILNLDKAFKFLKDTIPNFIILNTIKGDKIEFLQGTQGHYKNISKEELEKALWIYDNNL